MTKNELLGGLLVGGGLLLFGGKKSRAEDIDGGEEVPPRAAAEAATAEVVAHQETAAKHEAAAEKHEAAAEGHKATAAKHKAAAKKHKESAEEKKVDANAQARGIQTFNGLRANGDSIAVASAFGLFSYLEAGGTHPGTIKSYQRGMGGISVDGIVGPKTKARAKELGAELP